MSLAIRPFGLIFALCAIAGAQTRGDSASTAATHPFSPDRPLPLLRTDAHLVPAPAEASLLPRFPSATQPSPCAFSAPPSLALHSPFPVLPTAQSAPEVSGPALTPAPVVARPPLLVQGLLGGALVYSIAKTAPPAKAKPNWPW